MRTHKSSLSFVDQSQPVEPVENRAAAAVEPAMPPAGALAAYRAGNQNVRAIQDAAAAEFREKFAGLLEGLNPMLHQFIAKAEQARQIGIVLIEFADTLSGRRLTRDFYEQSKDWFVDAQGRQVSLELLEWFMAVARKNVEPIEDMGTALKYVQPLLLTSGEPEFQLVSESPVKHRIAPKDELAQLQSWLEYPEVVEVWQKLKANPHYFQDGHLRPSLRATMAEEFRPVIAVVDELKAELGL